MTRRVPLSPKPLPLETARRGFRHPKNSRSLGSRPVRPVAPGPRVGDEQRACSGRMIRSRWTGLSALANLAATKWAAEPPLRASEKEASGAS
jgi:hypothetical protein